MANTGVVPAIVLCPKYNGVSFSRDPLIGTNQIDLTANLAQKLITARESKPETKTVFSRTVWQNLRSQDS